jgi:glycosyltransferase involved in cell wall biosynthesis
MPTVSVIIPTLNAAQYLDECLASIRAQDYPTDLVQVIIADAGSTDRTLVIAQSHGVDMIVPNPLRTGEAGKACALRAASGELILSVDSDNVLVGTDWLRRMVAPFGDGEVWATQALRFAYRRSDPPMFRYHALLGAGDPLAIYIGNYDRLSALTGQWTGCPHHSERRNGWIRVTLDSGAIPTLGANGFMFRRSVLPESTVNDPYFFDIDVAADLVLAGQHTIGIVDVPIRHYFCRDLRVYHRKTRRRIDDFMFHRSTGGRTYPWTRSRAGILRFVLSTVLVVPLLVDVQRGLRRVPDPAWWLHLPVCVMTLGIYAAGVLRGLRRPRELDRSNWRQ